MTPTIAQQVVALQTLDVPALVAKYTETFGTPPHCKNRIWLWRNVAWKIQEQAFGGLSDEGGVRLEALIAEIIFPTAPPERTKRVPVSSRRNRDELPVGTVLSRRWRDRDVRVTVVTAGFEYDGRLFRSLSAIATTVTGTHWNGRVFFGVTERTKAS